MVFVGGLPSLQRGQASLAWNKCLKNVKLQEKTDVMNTES
jgi:hypothetical protein